MLQQGATEPLQSWISKVVLVPEPNGSWRFCIDYSWLSSIVVKDMDSISRKNDCIDSFLNSCWFFTYKADPG